MQDRVPGSQHSTPSGEMDITEAFAAIGQFGKTILINLGLALLKFRAVTRTYIWLLLACLLIGVAIGYLRFRSFQPYYTSDLLFDAPYYTENILFNVTGELNQLIQKSDYAALAEKLQLTPEQANNILSISSRPLISRHEVVQLETILTILRSIGDVEGAPELTEEQLTAIRNKLSTHADTYLLSISLTEPLYLDAYEKGLLTHMNQQEYVQKKVAESTETLQLLYAKLQSEQEQLNQLNNEQGLQVKEPQGGAGARTLQSADLYRRIAEVKEKLAHKAGVELVHGFSYAVTAPGPSLTKQLVQGALIGLAVGYLILLLINFNAALNKLEVRRRGTV